MLKQFGVISAPKSISALPPVHDGQRPAAHVCRWFDAPGQVGSDVTQPIGQGCTAVFDQLIPDVVEIPASITIGEQARTLRRKCLGPSARRFGAHAGGTQPTAISGETARFPAGGEYPIPVVDRSASFR